MVFVGLRRSRPTCGAGAMGVQPQLAYLKAGVFANGDPNAVVTVVRGKEGQSFSERNISVLQ